MIPRHSNQTQAVRRSLLVIVVLITVAGPGRQSSAQGLAFSLFEGYLESTREQAGIPGLSAAIVRDGVVVWDRGFGRQDVEAGIAASADTTYLIGELSQVFGATLLLKKCLDESHLELSDPVTRWVPEYDEPLTTIQDLLSHTSPAGTFRYDPARFSALTRVIEQCARTPYPHLLGDELFARLGMARSAPGSAIAELGTDTGAGAALPPATVQHYGDVLRTLARPYRMVGDRPVRSDVPVIVADAGRGIVTSARDVARFDSALGGGVLLSANTLTTAWTQVRAGGVPLPTGLGWFVQNYGGEPLVWQFGLHKDAYSSLILTLPNRGLTLILLANSDGLSAPFALGNGDVTKSIFARIFLRLFVS
jgi:CubicO group peptidase (beta-lactamase class C family)